jgi:pantothenate synthetase
LKETLNCSKKSVSAVFAPDAAKIIDTAAKLIRSHPGTLDDMKTIDRPALMALAVRIGEARLIDNMILKP